MPAVSEHKFFIKMLKNLYVCSNIITLVWPGTINKVTIRATRNDFYVDLQDEARTEGGEKVRILIYH